MRVGSESLLTLLLGLKRGETRLRLRLSRHAVGGRPGSVRLSKRRARPTGLGGVKALRFLRTHGRLLADWLALAKAGRCASKHVHTTAKCVGTTSRRRSRRSGLLGLRRLGRSRAAIDRVPSRHGLAETGSCRRRGVVIRESSSVRLTVHARSLAVGAILVAVAVLRVVLHVVVIVPAGIVVHRAVAAELVLLVHLAHVRGVVRVGVVRISVPVGMSSGSSLARHVLSSRRGLSSRSTRQGRVRGRVTAVGGSSSSIDMAVTARRLSSGGWDLGLLHFSTRNTTKASSRTLSHIGILSLAVGTVVVVGETLINRVEGRVLAGGSGGGAAGRLDGSLIRKRLLRLWLRLRDLLAEGIVRLLGIGVASEIGKGVVGRVQLRYRRQSRGGAGDSRRCHLSGHGLRLLLLLLMLLLSQSRRQRGTRSNGGVLRGLSTGFGLFPVLIQLVRTSTGCIAIQAHAAKLHGGTVDSVVAGHHHGFLLFHHPTLEARSAATASLPGSAGGIGRGSCPGRSGCGLIKSTAHVAGDCGSGG